MGVPKIQVAPVNIGAAADDGTGDKLRKALELLNSNDASLEEVLAYILEGADPELSSFAQIAQIIYEFNAVVQALPLPAAIQAQVTTAINAALAQLPTPESYTAQIQTAIAAAVAALDANNLVKKSGDQLTGALDFAATVSVASAATTDLSNTASNNVEVTGVATVTSFGVRPPGAIRFVRFRDAGLTLTHDPVNLILPGAANIVTGAGDTAILRSHGSGGWRVFAYQRGNGTALVAPIIVPGPTLDDFRTALIQIAKLKGSTVGMAAGVADDFRDQSGVDTANSVGAFYDAAGNVVTNLTAETSSSLPAMTSNTAPSGYVASASSELSASTQAYAAFDKATPVSGAGWSSNTAVPAWVQQKTPSAIKLAAYAITAANSNSGSADLKSWTFSGSNDNTTWTVLDTRTGAAAWGALERRVFSIPSAQRGAYLYHRLTVTEVQGNGGFYPVINEIASLQEVAVALDLRSAAFTAAAVPAKGSIFALVKATTGAITPNTNLLADISRDGGTTWTAGTLVSAGSYGGFTMYEANGFDISGQPSGTSMKWRLRTVGAALAVAVDAVVAQWG